MPDRAESRSVDVVSIRAERDRYREALELVAALLPEDARAIAKEALTNGRTDMTEMTATPLVPLGPIPLSYVYVARLQGASKAIREAIDASADQRMDGAAAGEAVERARQWLAGIYALKAEGVES